MKQTDGLDSLLSQTLTCEEHSDNFAKKEIDEVDGPVCDEGYEERTQIRLRRRRFET